MVGDALRGYRALAGGVTEVTAAQARAAACQHHLGLGTAARAGDTTGRRP